MFSIPNLEFSQKKGSILTPPLINLCSTIQIPESDSDALYYCKF